MSWGPELFRRQRRRLAIGFTVLLMGVLAGFGWIAYDALNATLTAQADAANEQACQALLSSVSWHGGTPVLDHREFDHEVSEMVLAHGLVIAQVHDGQGRLIYRRRHAPGPLRPTGRSRRLVAGEPPLRVRELAVPNHGTPKLTLLVGTDWRHAEQTLARAVRRVATGVALGALAAAAIAVGLASVIIRPIQRAFEQQQRFVADAAHELRTPAAIVRAHLDVALHETGGTAAGPTIAAAETAVGRLEQVLDSLLTLARIDAQAPAFVTFRLDELLDELLDDFAHLAATAGVALTGAVWPAVVIEADPEQLRRLLANLLDNALHHTPAGGRVSLGLATTGDHVRLQVSDTGCGISEAHRHRIFERFYRGLTSATPYSGSGLGLAIAQAIAVAHGGQLGVDNHADAGCVFTVTLPLRQSVFGAPATASP